MFVYVIDTVRVFFQGDAKATFVVRRTKSAYNACKRTLWKKERGQVSDLYDRRKTTQQIRYLHVNYKHFVKFL